MKRLKSVGSGVMQRCLQAGAHRVLWQDSPEDRELRVELWNSWEDPTERCRVLVTFRPKDRVPTWRVSGPVGYQISVMLVDIGQYPSIEGALGVAQWGLNLAELLMQEIHREPLEWS